MNRKGVNAFDPERGLLVAEKRCNECLFSKNKIVSDRRKEDVLKTCDRRGTYFICHKAADGPPVICRGFFDEVPNRTCHMARVLKVVKFVDPATGEPHEKSEAADRSGRETSRDQEG